MVTVTLPRHAYGPIETARPEDAGAVIALWENCELTRPSNPPRADFERALAGPASDILVLRAREGTHDAGDGRIAGSVMVGHDGHRGWLYYLAVHPGLRGRGIGRALVTAAESWLRARGVPKAMLMVRTTNERAMPFYDALGYGTAEVVVRERRIDGHERA